MNRPSQTIRTASFGEPMTQYVFVPLSDDLLFDTPEKITGPLVAFNPEFRIDLKIDTQNVNQPCKTLTSKSDKNAATRGE
ncbi:MAG: hypothetical protein ACI9FD_003735 [Gammaproteobacteria bacterium]|jgi:hypothetical protein